MALPGKPPGSLRTPDSSNEPDAQAEGRPASQRPTGSSDQTRRYQERKPGTLPVPGPLGSP
ncbi:Hypothetical predicted protein [Marmota monax]|uniref:Uncharacterized protein n=1 Tax=Marmota monax TaxID=9995 RepID=A0A5E4CQ14_MARMO|nr:hypothetical protein GHT09_014165 [Marmota monax]VTJ83867.1 Hypothetical predicted protein [Marmota monax]